MEMVSASKMRRAQQRVQRGRPYADTVRAIAHDLSHALPEYRHPFLGSVRNVVIQSVGMIVVTSDKGLCGGLNNGLLRTVLQHVREAKTVQKVCYTVFGEKGISFGRRMGWDLRSYLSGINDRIISEQALGVLTVMLDTFLSGQVDCVYLCYNRFINTMKQERIIEQFLPIPFADNRPESGTKRPDYLYEPSAPVVLEVLIKRYLEALIFQAIAENVASEHSARMVAMKAASNNALEIIHCLRIQYNKARQAAITKELAEIFGGAAAV